MTFLGGLKQDINLHTLSMQTALSEPMQHSGNLMSD